MTATTPQIPWLRVFVEGVVIVGKLGIVLFFVGCVAPLSQLIVASAGSPDETYSCYLQALGEMGFNRVEEADRGSGFMFVVRVRDDFGPVQEGPMGRAVAKDIPQQPKRDSA